MTEISNEFILQDRIQKIQQIIGKYGEENFYISFSGGKDSVVLHNLIDMALPNNKIPRVYCNTGIEFKDVSEFVKDMQKTDSRITIIRPDENIVSVLNKYGYPFKSKVHSIKLRTFQNNGLTFGVGAYLWLHPQKNGKMAKMKCPKKLMYQFSDEFDLKVSHQCCVWLKEKPMIKYAKESGYKYAIEGIMIDEGGGRVNAKCLAFTKKKQGDELKAFQPLTPITKEWENWFVAKYNIKLCKLYYPPYNFRRTSCKGCPFAMHLQDELDVMQEFFPNERKQCEIIWKPVYAEYRRIGYRLKKEEGQNG